MQSSVEVLNLAGGDAYKAALNHFDAGGGCMVTTVQVDHRVYVVGQDGYDVLDYSLDCWNDLECKDGEPVEHRCADAAEALGVLTKAMRGRLVWQCGGCDAWIHTTGQPHMGVLRCHACADGGVDFHHAYRNIGLDED